MFLIILEDGMINAVKDPKPYYSAVEDGICSLIDITNPDLPLEYDGDKWISIEVTES